MNQSNIEIKSNNYDNNGVLDQTTKERLIKSIKEIISHSNPKPSSFEILQFCKSVCDEWKSIFQSVDTELEFIR